jgi:nitrous oxidase accessory protein NosD
MWREFIQSFLGNHFGITYTGMVENDDSLHTQSFLGQNKKQVQDDLDEMVTVF